MIAVDVRLVERRESLQNNPELVLEVTFLIDIV